MPVPAAPATLTTAPIGALTVILIVVTLGYLAVCVIWPFRACRHCRGIGRHTGPMRGVRLCRHCEGTGLRLRAGRRAWRAGRRIYRDLHPRAPRR